MPQPPVSCARKLNVVEVWPWFCGEFTWPDNGDTTAGTAAAAGCARPPVSVTAAAAWARRTRHAGCLPRA